jgi:hypothetical protein
MISAIAEEVFMRRLAAAPPFIRSAMRSLLSSLATVAVLAVVEGAVLMQMGWDWGYKLFGDIYREVQVIDFAIGQPGGTGISLVRAIHRDPAIKHEALIGFHGFAHSPSCVQPSPFPDARIVAAIPNSSRALMGCAEGQIYQLDASAPLEPPRLLGRHEPGCLDVLSCSQDGQRLASVSIKGLCVWDLTSQEMIWRRTEEGFTCAVFLPDGLHLLAGTVEGQIIEIDALSGATTRAIATLDLPLFQLDVSADGKRLLAMCGDKTAVLLDPRTGAQLWSRQHRHSRVAFSPVDDLVASHTYSLARGSLVVLWDPRTGEELAAMPGHTALILGVTFSPDGSLYSWGLDGTICQWDAQLRRQVACVPALAARAS